LLLIAFEPQNEECWVENAGGGSQEAMVENECAMMTLPANGTLYHKATSRVTTQRLVTGQNISRL
jgi:hypothetical protein